MSIRNVFTAALALAAAGCATTHSRPTETARTVVVPAGTALTVALDESIGTAVSMPGDRFFMHLAAPLHAQDGTAIAPRGTLLRGRIASITAGDHPALRFDVVSIATVYGIVPLQARFVNPDPNAPRDASAISMAPPRETPVTLTPGSLASGYGSSEVQPPAPAALGSTSNGTSYTAGGYGVRSAAANNPPAVGGGPAATGTAAPAVTSVVTPSVASSVTVPAGADLVIPTGAHLRMVLQAPLVATLPRAVASN